MTDDQAWEQSQRVTTGFVGPWLQSRAAAEGYAHSLTASLRRGGPSAACFSILGDENVGYRVWQYNPSIKGLQLE